MSTLKAVWPCWPGCDAAGARHAFVYALFELGIEFSIGMEMRKAVRLAILALPSSARTEAITAQGEIREGAQVAELIELDLSNWPVGTRAIVRREEPHVGAQFNLGWRHQVFITKSSDTDIAYLEARHRGHARVEDRIRCAKDTGLRNPPFADLANNACWVELIWLAQDLIAFTQGLVISRSDLIRSHGLDAIVGLQACSGHRATPQG